MNSRLEEFNKWKNEETFKSIELNEMRIDDINKIYRELTVLDKKGKIVLVQDKSTKRIYVKKEVDEKDYNLYSKLQSIDNKNLPKIEKIFKEGDRLIIIEEFINGDNLEEVINKRGLLSDEDTKHIVLSVINALKDLHNVDKPIIHRDIKPSNIMVDGNNLVKLIDFDAAREYKGDASEDTELLGTRQYAAPEHFGFGETDCRSDVYSLGILMNVLLTNKYPKELIYDGNFSEVIKKSTDLDASKRFQTVLEFEEALDKGFYRKVSIDKNGGIAKNEMINNEHKSNASKTKFKTYSETFKALRETIKSEYKNSKDIYGTIIPGFRTHNIWKNIIAILGYIMIFSIGISVEVKGEMPLYIEIFEKICSFFAILGASLIAANFLGCTKYTLWSRYGGGRKLLGIALAMFLWMLLCAALSVTFSEVYLAM